MRSTRVVLLVTILAATLVLPALADAQPRGRAVPRGAVRPPIVRSTPPVVRVVPSYRYYGGWAPGVGLGGVGLGGVGLGFYYGAPWAWGPTTWGPYGYGYGRFTYGAAPFAFGAGVPGYYGASPYGYGYGSPYPYGYGYGYGYAPRTSGGVRLDLPQLDAEVYVDGYYAGIVDDFDGAFQEVPLEPGPHRIEVRSQGFEPISFEVNSQPGRTITYRATLRPALP